VRHIWVLVNLEGLIIEAYLRRDNIDEDLLEAVKEGKFKLVKYAPIAPGGNA